MHFEAVNTYIILYQAADYKNKTGMEATKRRWGTRKKTGQKLVATPKGTDVVGGFSATWPMVQQHWH